MPVVQTRYNYLMNPSFETDDLYWGLGGGGTKAQTSAQAYSGTGSLLFTGTAIDDRIYATIADGLPTPTIGASYTFSVYLRGSGQLKLWVYNGATDSYSASLITLTSTWTRYSLTVVCAGSTMYAGLRLTTNNAVSCYMDAAQFEEYAMPTGYFDGSVYDGQWQGSAHSSISYINFNFTTTVGVGSQSLDVITNTRAEIDAVVAAIVSNYPGIDYIAIFTYMNYVDQIQMWIEAIHLAGKRVSLRSAGFDDWMGYHGSAQYAAADFAQHSTDQYLDWVKANYHLLRANDIFEPFPDESENNPLWNTFYGTIGSGAGLTAFNDFVTTAVSEIEALLIRKSVTGVKVRVLYGNASLIKDVVTSATATLLDILGTDDYPEIASTTNAEREAAMDAEIATWINPAHVGRSKSITFGPDVYTQLTDANQADAFEREIGAIKNHVVGLSDITIWSFGAVDNAPKSRIFDYTAMVWVERLQTAIAINRALGPTIPFLDLPTDVSNSSDRRGVSSKNKYSWQIFIDGFLFADLTSLAQDRTFTKSRNAPDEITFSVNLDALEQYARDSKINAQDILRAGVSEIRVARYGVVLVAGQLVNWTADLATDRKVTLVFKGWYDLLNYRITTKTYTNKTALEIIQDQITITQGKSFGSFGYVFGLLPDVDTTNLYTEKIYTDKLLYDIFSELAKEDGGFDFEFTWDKKINIYHPAQGVRREDIVFSYPGNIQDIKLTNDVTKIVNSLHIRGSGYDEGQKSQDVSDTQSQETYALREGILDYPDVSDEQQLLRLGTSEQDLFKQPVILHDVTLDGSQDPQVGSFNIGDSVRLSVTKLLKLYSGINNFYRIDRYTVTIGAEGEETITVSAN